MISLCCLCRKLVLHTCCKFVLQARVALVVTANLLQVRFKFDASNFAMTSQNQTCCKLTCYLGKYEASKTVSKTSRNVRSIEIEDGTLKEKDEKFDCLLETLEKLLNSHVARKKTPRRNPNMTCWKCNKKGQLQCQTISPNREKLMYGRLTGRRLSFLNKAPEEGLKVSALCGGRNGLYLEGSICGIPCLMLVDTGANVTLVRTDLAQKLKGNFIYTAPNISLKTATGEKAEIHGKLDAANADLENSNTKSTYLTSPIPVFSAWIFYKNLTSWWTWRGTRFGQEERKFLCFQPVQRIQSYALYWLKRKLLYQQDRNVLSRESQKLLENSDTP
ncbi:hypothetical protein AVEN_107664-1 [Araneus ventricosus]|uniref:Peptidase A2 domain-containing protein n=1 Tax=Araneus ventricosus TaxID=182803 RepID=A0A4Y2TVT0_ARAVE|nr:hypothetical protein AVEN_107664-1 [Araneus ventricosus]